jgi:hypothetical protein
MKIDSILHSRILVLILFSLVFSRTEGQVKFSTVTSSKEIGKSDYVQIEFVVENAQQIEDITPPFFHDFQIVKGPIQSSGMSIVNGAMSQYKALSFVLQPTKMGKFTLQGATATIDGKHMSSNPVTIEVVAQSKAVPLQRIPQTVWPGEELDFDRDYILRPGENINDKIRKNLFVKVQVSKVHCYVGEPIVATYKLYSRLQSESRVTRHPSLNGFSVHDMIDPTSDVSSIENVHGMPFTVHIIRKAQLIPLQAGTIDLDPVEVENIVHFVKSNGPVKRRNSNPLQELFDRFSGDDEAGERVDQHVVLESKPVAIAVKALPLENKPESFNGAVGQFTVTASLDARDIVAEDASTLKLTVKGSGNLPVVNAPAVSWPKGIEDYSASAKEQVDKTIAPMSGFKTFEYKFIPSVAGPYTIPPVTFSYFDPLKAVYKTLETQAFDIKVTRNKATAGRTAILSKTPKETDNGVAIFLQKHLEWFFAILILSGLAIYLLIQNSRLRRNEELLRPVERSATQPTIEEPLVIPPTPDPLETSRELMEAGQYPAFYRELNHVVWHGVADKLQLRASELNKYNIVTQLTSKGWNRSQTALLEDTLNECEMKLYTPDYSETDLLRILQHAEQILQWLRA